MEDINWQDIQQEIEDSIWSILEIVDISELLVDKLGFTLEDAEEIMDKIFQQVEDAEEEYKTDLARDISSYLAECVRIRNTKIYPEDDPDQLHLFELEE